MKHNLKAKKLFLLPLLGLIFAFFGIITPVNPALAEPATSPEVAEEAADEAENTPENNNINISENQDRKTDSTETEDNPESAEETATGESSEEGTAEDPTDEEIENTCYDQVEAIGWLICPTTGVLANAIDSIYGIIENFLIIDPITANNKSPIYIVWQYARDVTNIVFIIMLLVVVWSQLTGIGISNYGVKKVLPRLIITAILVNLSFILCALAVDASNILGVTLKGLFTSIEKTAITNLDLDGSGVSWTGLVTALTTGTAVTGLAIGITGGLGQFLWMLIGATIGAVLAVFVGLVTISLRQAVVAMLIMISPLAFVAYLLPNTERYFEKWKNTLFSMLVFYPMFSLLFGASQLAGWTLIASAKSAFGVILGMTVQVLPLFLSVSLMKMSGTALGAVSGFLGGFAAKGAVHAHKSANIAREQARQHYIANAPTASAGLRRYMDYRRRLSEIDTKNSMDIRLGNAEKAAQGYIRGKRSYFANSGFLKDQNGKTIRDQNGNPIPIDNLGFKTNRYTRNAAKVGAIAMETENASRDTAHVIGNYGSYHGKTLSDRQLSARVMTAYKNSARTEITAVNDNEADVEWLVNQYLDITKAKGYKSELKAIDTRAASALSAATTDKERAEISAKFAKERSDFIHNTPEYRHYITSAAGSLGERGTESVLGQIIEKAAKNEARHRKQAALLAAKYKYNKAEARSMYVGYKVDDNGLATNYDGSPFKFAVDRNGKPYIDENPDKNTHEEKIPGYLLRNNPAVLKDIRYNLHDEHGDAYYNMTDQDGNFVTRVYRKDGPLVKELLSNTDMPINDPINGLYGILAGHNQGEFADVGLPDVGLANFSTTIGRGLLAAKFKEKAAFAGPMYTTSVMNRYIKDYVHQNLARLDNLGKTAKPGNFNTQDAFEIGQLQTLMDPKNWPALFPEDSLRNFVNVNGELMKGTRILRDEKGEILRDENGEILTESVVRKDESDATYEELMNTVMKKYLIPAAPKFASMMSRFTQGTADNQKPGTEGPWHNLYEAMESWNNPKYKEKYPFLVNPFAKQKNSTFAMSRDIRKRIQPNTNPKKSKNRSAYSTDDPAASDTILHSHTDDMDIDDVKNIFAQLDLIHEENSYDASAFSDEILDYLTNSYAKTGDERYNTAYEAVANYIHANPFASVEDLYEEIESILISIFYD